jgi:hypothetical protein
VRDWESGIEDYLGFLQSLCSKHPSQFLFGGQAVNFWAEYFDRQSSPRQLGSFRPFTSKDCDIWVSAPVWKEIKHEESDRLVLGSSPADGQLGVLTLQKAPRRAVDLLSSVYGIRMQDLDRVCERAPVFSGVKVLDPIYLFLSKCHCFLGLDQNGRQDERHVRMLALILPEYLSLLMAKAGEEGIPDRAILREIKLLLKILGSRACRRTMDELEIHSDSLIPWERMETCGLKALEDYARAEGRRRPSQG